MKLVIAIISNTDIEHVLAATSREGFFATRIATVGQFLKTGHTAIFVGTQEEKLDLLFDIIKKNVTKRTIKTHGVTSTVEGSLLKAPIDVEENGAVAFVIDVEQFIKL